jgi:putative acyl-CoA dehydrogenase
VLRTLEREREPAHAVLSDLARDASGLPGVTAALGAIESALTGPESEAQARVAVERLALVAAAAALATSAPGEVADAFARARLAGLSGRTYGTAALEPAARALLLGRALPQV